MEVYVRFEAFDSIAAPSEILDLREAVGTAMQRIEKSGCLIEGRVFVGVRGGVLLLDVQDEEQLFELLSPGIVDHCHTDVRPVIGLAKLGRFFEEDNPRLAREVQAPTA